MGVGKDNNIVNKSLEKHFVMNEFNYCVHSKKLRYIIDETENVYKIYFWKNHLRNCDICRKEISRLSNENTLFMKLIPKHRIDLTIIQSINNEVYDLYLNYNTNGTSKENIWKKFIQKIKMISYFFSQLRKAGK